MAATSRPIIGFGADNLNEKKLTSHSNLPFSMCRYNNPSTTHQHLIHGSPHYIMSDASSRRRRSELVVVDDSEWLT